MKKKIFLPLASILVLIGSVLSFPDRQDLNISLKETAIKDFGLSGLSIVFYLDISNSSSSPCYLSSYEYRLVVNQQEYIRLATSPEKRIEIEAKKDTLLSLPLRITYENLFQTVAGIEKEDKAQCYLSGTMIFSDEKKEKGRIPFAFSAEFPIFKEPEVQFLSLQIKEMTIGGADLDFELSFKNNNSYELYVDRISYTFYLAEKEVGEGVIAGDKNIEARGEKAFSLPFLFNFFDIGKEIYDVLLQSSAPCRFVGEIEVRTVWGILKIPFDRSDKVKISRTS